MVLRTTRWTGDSIFETPVSHRHTSINPKLYPGTMGRSQRWEVDQSMSESGKEGVRQGGSQARGESGKDEV
jgi:hypothetical protein